MKLFKVVEHLMSQTSNILKSWESFTIHVSYPSQMLHVWNIYLHLGHVGCKCWSVFYTWSIYPVTFDGFFIYIYRFYINYSWQLCSYRFYMCILYMLGNYPWQDDVLWVNLGQAASWRNGGCPWLPYFHLMNCDTCGSSKALDFEGALLYCQ